MILHEHYISTIIIKLVLYLGLNHKIDILFIKLICSGDYLFTLGINVYCSVFILAVKSYYFFICINMSLV